MNFRICSNENCGAIIPEEKCLVEEYFDIKHPPARFFCPVCKWTAEAISEEDISCDKCVSLFGGINAKMATVHVPGVITFMDHYCAEHFLELHPILGCGLTDADKERARNAFRHSQFIEFLWE